MLCNTLHSVLVYKPESQCMNSYTCGIWLAFPDGGPSGPGKRGEREDMGDWPVLPPVGMGGRSGAGLAMGGTTGEWGD